MNNNTLTEAQKWLTEMGIKTIDRHSTYLMVNRTDLLNIGSGDETRIHADVLSALKTAVSNKLFWGGREDDYLYLDSF